MAARIRELLTADDASASLSCRMATTAYVVGAHFGWRRGLSAGIGRARGSCAILVASIGLALAVTLAGISGNRHAGGSQRNQRVRNPDRPGDPGPRGPRSPGHGSPAHLPSAGHRGWAGAVIVGGFGLPAVLGAAPGTFCLPRTLTTTYQAART